MLAAAFDRDFTRTGSDIEAFALALLLKTPTSSQGLYEVIHLNKDCGDREVALLTPFVAL